MRRFEIQYPLGATPLNPNELAGLIPRYVRTQGELNFLERNNIVAAMNWAEKLKRPDVLSASFTYRLHKRMFGQVWRWAGKPRLSEKNIGIPWNQISTALSVLFQNVKYWIEKETYSWDEIGARFHHRMVEIHVFPNGNGRHARFMTDLLLKSHGREIFSWGARPGPLAAENENLIRTQYIEALREADQKRFEKLIRFVRS